MTTVTAPSSTEPRAASEPRVRRRRTKRPGWWVVAALLAAFAFLWVFVIEPYRTLIADFKKRVFRAPQPQVRKAEVSKALG
jgi:hypothetical protein